MYRIGLTGGVGSGKSTVSSYMKEFGIPVIDGDCLAMEAVAPGNIAMREIRQVFGNGIFNEYGFRCFQSVQRTIFIKNSITENLPNFPHGNVAGSHCFHG